MIKQIFVCNKCGETIGEHPYLEMAREGQARYDLCPQCASGVIDWIEGGNQYPWMALIEKSADVEAAIKAGLTVKLMNPVNVEPAPIDPE